MTVQPLHDAPTRTGSPSPPPGLSSRPPAGLFPPLRDLLAWREPYLIPLLLLLATRCGLWFLLPTASEDAYITYRYARNLMIGLGPVYNPGEPVMGYTSPLWMVWNALGWLVTRDPASWSRLWSVCGDMVTLLLAASMLKRDLSRGSAWIFAFLFSAWTTFAAVTISGMENSMMLTLLVLAAGLAERGSRATGLALGALALIRPEGLVAAAIVALRAPRRERLVALGLAAVGIGALALFYGSPLPQSLLAKAEIYGAPGPWAARHWWEWALPLALGRWPTFPEGSPLYIISLLAAPAAVVGLVTMWRIRTRGIAFAAAAALAIWAGYAVLGVAYFFWYLTVPLAGYFVLVAAGLPKVLRGGAVYVGGALFVIGTWTVTGRLYVMRAEAEGQFARVADYLVAHSSPWETILLEPIGMIGYRVRLRVLDEVGLVTPAIARRRLEGAGWAADVTSAQRPEWIVMRRGVVESREAFAGRGAPFRSREERDSVLARYALVTVVGEDPQGASALLVMRRRAELAR